MLRTLIWCKEIEIIYRSLIFKKKYFLSYKVASKHALKDVPEYATMVGNPAKNISTNKDTSFKPYGVRDFEKK